VSLERIAEILNVDEVNLMHGPKGVALYVRVNGVWQSTTIDNNVLGKGRHRLETMTKSLADLADGLNKSLGRTDDLRKTISGATRAAIQADQMADARRRWLAEAQLGVPYGDGPQRQVQRAEPTPTPPPAPAPSPTPPAVSDPMPSRFHAIMAELGDL